MGFLSEHHRTRLAAQPWLLSGQTALQKLLSSASLSLNFMTPGTLDPRITFTRASIGTYFNVAGVLQTATTNTPRWDYDPVTHALRGLLIEEQRQNVIINSGAIATSWVPAAATIVAGATASPDGTTTGAKFTESNTAVAHTLTSPFTPVSATQYAFSIFAKAAGRSILFATGLGMSGASVLPQWDLSAGTDVSTGAAAGYSHGIQSVGNGWYSCWFTFTTTNTVPVSYSPALVVGGTNAYLGDGVSGIYLWGAQGEAGAFATSYIPTTAAAVTRSADVASMPTAAWFSAAQSSLVAEYMVPYSALTGATTCGSVQLQDGANTNLSELRHIAPSIAEARVFSGGANVGGGTSGSFVANAVQKHAATFSSLAGNTVLNGGTVTPFTFTGNPVGLNKLDIGFARAGTLNGWMRRVQYWPRALSNSELQQVTT